MNFLIVCAFYFWAFGVAGFAISFLIKRIERKKQAKKTNRMYQGKL